MSTQVDNRVVSMEFDNKRFESNVATSMGTLDKLKQKLNFSGAEKGFENVNSAAKKVDMNPLANGIEAVRSKFSACEVMAVTALANITNSAVNAGKRMVAALTIEPVKTGFNEYELKMDSIKTIIASTGESIENVNKYLNELNEYSDQTIYSFADMTQNIGKFTNAGVKLEDAVYAIKGISNEAAVSGANANEASRAMYNFAQALSAGYVKLIDWKSIELANMATVEFKNQLIETAVATGTLTKTSDGMYKTLSGNTLSATKNFNETLQDQWMTSEVLIETLKRYADENTDIGKKAKAAAQDVTKLSQVFDILKETAQSGWAKTWEIIFGDLNTAKKLFTPFTNYIGGLIDKMSDWRNELLEGALGRGLTKIFDGLDKIMSNVSDMIDKAKDKIDSVSDALNPVKGVIDGITKTLEEHNAVVDEVVNGLWGHTEKRWNALTEAGYDWVYVQNKVNEQLGNSKRRTSEYTEWLTKQGKATNDTTDAQTKLTKSDGELLASLCALSDEQLRQAGYTEDQIKALRDLQKIADKLGLSIEDLIANMDEINGRWLLLNGLKNIGKSIVAVFKAMKDAWVEIFPPPTSESLFNLIAGFHKLSTKLKVSEEAADKFKRTFKGVFAALDIVLTLISGPIKIAFKILKEILSAFDINILDATASIGDLIVKLRDWLDSVLNVGKIVEKVVPSLRKFIDAIKGWVKGLKETDNIPKYIIQGLVKGIINGVKIVGEVIWELGEALVESIKKVLGIHSPSTVFMEIGKNCIEGLVFGLKEGIPLVWNAVRNVVTQVLTAIGSMDFGTMFAGAMGIGTFLTVKKLVDVFAVIAKPLADLGDMLEDLGDMFEGFGKYLKAKALQLKSNAVLKLAIAIGILSLSVALLTRLDTGKLWGAVGAIAAMSAILIGLTFAVSKMSLVGEDLKKGTLGLLGMSAALLIIAIAMQKLSSIEADDVPKMVGILAVAIGAMAGLVLIFGKLSKVNARYIDKAGSMMLKMSIALLIMVGVAKLAGSLDQADIYKGVLVMAAFGLLCSGFAYMSKFTGENANKVGGMMLRMSVAMLVMVFVAKLAGSMNQSDIYKGIAVMAAFGLLCSGFAVISKFIGKDANKVGTMMMGMAVAMMLMVVVVKLAGNMEPSEIQNGLIVIGALALFCAAMVAVSKFAGEHAMKAGVMLLAMSGALLIMTGVLFLISKMDPNGVNRALVVVAVLETMFAGLIAVTKIAKDCTKTLIVITVAVALLAGAIIAMSFLDSNKVAIAAASLGTVIGMFAVLVGVTKFAGDAKKIAGVSAALLLVVAGLGGTLIAMARWGGSAESAIGSALALSILLTEMVGVMAILKVIGGVSTKAAASMAVIDLVVAGLGGILIAMARWGGSAESAIGSALALSILLTDMVGVMAILKGVRGTSAKAMGALAAITLVVGGLAAIFIVLSEFDCAPSIETAIALSILLTTICGALAILGLVGKMGIAALWGAAIILILITAMAQIAVGLGALMDAYPELEAFLDKGIPILDKIGYALGSFVGNTIGGTLEGISNGLPAVAENLSLFMEKVKPFIDGAKSVDASAMLGIAYLAGAILMLTTASILEGLSKFIIGGTDFTSFGEALSPLGEGLVAFSKATEGINVENVKAAAEALKIIADATGEIPNEGGLLGALVGNNDPAVFGDKLPLLGAGLKNFSDATEGINAENVKVAAEALKIIADATGEIPNEGGLLGALVGNNDPALFGDKLPLLGAGLKNFSDATEGINAENVKVAAAALKEVCLAAQEIPNEGGLIAKFAGENDPVIFAPKLGLLGQGLKDFADATEGMKPENVKAAGAALKEVCLAAQEIPNEGGLIAKFAGENDPAVFAPKLGPLGEGLKAFADATEGMKPDNVKAAAAALKDVCLAAQEIPNEGGLVGKFAGNNDPGVFAPKLGPLGEGIKAFSDNSEGVNVDNVKLACDALILICDAAKEIPNEGGLIGKFTGNNDPGVFAPKLGPLGEGIKAFHDETKGINMEHMKSAVGCLRQLIDAAKAIPNEGGLKAAFTGKNDPEAFAGKLPVLGQGLKGFADSLAGVTVDSMRIAVNAASMLGKIANVDYGNISSMDAYGNKIKAFGEKAAAFYTAIKDVTYTDTAKAEIISDSLAKCSNAIGNSKATAAAKAMKELAGAATSISNIKSTAADGFKTAMDKLATTDIDTIVSKFSDSAPKLTTAASSLMDAFITGVNNKQTALTGAGTTAVTAFTSGMHQAKTTAVTTIGTLVSECANAIRNKSSDFYKAGTFVVSGFANGITAMTFMATARAKAMAAAAEQAAKDELDINSPSKVFTEIGSFIPRGFAIGIGKFRGSVVKSSTAMADTAVSSVGTAVAKVADAINSDIDAQPTIRPVIDLSGVRSGVNAIGGMFSGRRTLAVDTGTIGTVSAAMAGFQNGNNSDELVSVIKALRGDIADMPRNTYNINGVTYDDGSNISTAVGELIRAARIERRI